MEFVKETTDYDQRFRLLNPVTPDLQMPAGKNEVPIWEKELLTLDEAAAYTGIGVHKLRCISNDEHCDFVLWNGSKRLLKRKKLGTYLAEAYSI